MNTCSNSYNHNHLTLDAYQIAEIIFSDNTNTNIQKFNFEDMDLKTYFEMLLIITTEGMKNKYGEPDSTIDISNLSKENIDDINSYLIHLDVRLNIEIIDRITWNFSEKKIKSWNDININSKTQLEELKFILDKNDFIIIYFSKL